MDQRERQFLRRCAWRVQALAEGDLSERSTRQAPLARLLTTLVKVWYARCAATTPSLLPEAPAWNPGKTRPSFPDMLEALRRSLWNHRLFPNST